MNKTKAKPSTGEGWAVHVYDRERHLLFTIEPSHIWAFGYGIGMGLLVAIVWSALYTASDSLSTNTNQLTNLAPTSETETREGFSTDPTSSLTFGID